MPNVKISTLPEATSISSTDVAPVVTGGITKKASAATIVKAVLPAPGAIGSTTPDTGTFTTLTATDASGLQNVDANNVNYDEGSSGAVDRTVADKLRESVSVMDFGAVGDGTTSSATAFSNAYNGAPANSTLNVGPGNYITGGLTGTKPILWLCDGSLNQSGSAPLSLPGVIETYFNGRKLFSRQQSTSTDYSTVHVQRNTTHTGGTVGYVNSAFRADTTVSNSGAANYEWTIVGVMDNSASAGENVAIYGQAIKRSTGPTWAAVFEARDMTTNPTTGLVAVEIDVFGNGTDVHNSRVGVDVVVGKVNPSGSAVEVGHGIRITPTNGDFSVGRCKVGFSVSIDSDCGYDTSTGTFTSGGPAYRLAANQYISMTATNDRTFSYSTANNAFQWIVNGSPIVSFNENGAIGVGTSSLANYGLRVSKNITGATSSFGVVSDGVIQSDVTSSASIYASFPSTQATAFNLPRLIHYYAAPATFGSGSSVTSQYGFVAESSINGATNNYGFYGNIAAGTGRYNLYMAGTADNYLAGRLGIGNIPVANYSVLNTLPITGASNSWGISSQGTIQSDVTNTAAYFRTAASTAAASFTTSEINHYWASQNTIGAGSTVTNQIGFHATPSLTGATNNYGFYGNIAAGTGRYNLYMAGTADNYIKGNTYIGTLTSYGTLSIQGSQGLSCSSGDTTNNRSLKFYIDGTLYGGIYSPNGKSLAFQGGAGTLTDALVIDQSNNVRVVGSGGLGYGTGSGGAVTQITSRTTGVTINKTNGAITLVSAAGSAIYQSFTVTNSTVAATDTIIINQKSGTDKYIIMVTAVAAGSFVITFATTGGVTTEQPVFNFAVIKAVTA